MNDYEKLGAFYLGRRYDPERGCVTPEDLLYDSRDLTTHAVCVGMTGSGKTGLCISLLEEAAIDGIPAIAIDPKGDLSNLLLSFPELRPSDFLPWIDAGEAARQGRSAEEQARATAELWRRGLAEWGQDGERIARLQRSADFAIYTPGASAGRPLSVMGSFAAPPGDAAADPDARRERVLASVSGLLALAGLDGDPVRSREHVLISAILDRAWSEGRSLDLAGLIREIQSPPFERLGVLDLESFFPGRERFELAMRLNGLLASPAFAAWSEGEPLDVGGLLHAPDGRPRISILSIAHLPDAERMFFVTLLLSEVIAWMRAQPGTSSLRAILYMDEVFGFLPPSAAPPSKLPMLTLLKQARAYGLGVVLATQNPVDLDYKALSNAGTWFLGRLQTERDKARVMDGLEGASAAAGAAFDRAAIDRMLSGLSNRVFLMHDVHEDAPSLFHTRWALSYLRGPLSRAQLAALIAQRRETPPAAPPPPSAARRVEAAPEVPRPLLDPKIEQRFLACSAGREGRLLYRPALLGAGTLHYVKAGAGLDAWQPVALLALLGEDPPDDPWQEALALPGAPPELEEDPPADAGYAALPAAAARPASYARWSKQLAAHLYRRQPLQLFRCEDPPAISRPGEAEGAFRSRLRELTHERRDLELEKLRKRYAPKLARLAERMRRAEERVERERSQYQQQTLQAGISLGATLLGALLGRKLASARNVGRATTAARGAGRAARERADVERAAESLEQLRGRLAELEAEFQQQIEALRSGTAAEPRLRGVEIPPRKSDLAVEPVVLVWTPWRVGPDGKAQPDFATRA